jgi:hypothetical protein
MPFLVKMVGKSSLSWRGSSRPLQADALPQEKELPTPFQALNDEWPVFRRPVLFLRDGCAEHYLGNEKFPLTACVIYISAQQFLQS